MNQAAPSSNAGLVRAGIRGPVRLRMDMARRRVRTVNSQVMRAVAQDLGGVCTNALTCHERRHSVAQLDADDHEYDEAERTSASRERAHAPSFWLPFTEHNRTLPPASHRRNRAGRDNNRCLYHQSSWHRDVKRYMP